LRRLIRVDTMDDHLVPLGGDWALRRDFAVRSAGFPVAGLDAFGADDEQARLHEIAVDPAFREAVTWQNRDVLASAVDGLLEAGARRARGGGARRSLLATGSVTARRTTRSGSSGRSRGASFATMAPRSRNTLAAWSVSARFTLRPGASSASCRRSRTTLGCHSAPGRRKTPRSGSSRSPTTLLAIARRPGSLASRWHANASRPRRAMSSARLSTNSIASSRTPSANRRFARQSSRAAVAPLFTWTRCATLMSTSVPAWLPSSLLPLHRCWRVRGGCAGVASSWAAG
jgi:hypothetical protein